MSENTADTTPTTGADDPLATLRAERDHYLEGFEALRRGTQALLDAVKARNWLKATAVAAEMTETEAARRRLVLDRDGTIRATGWAVDLLSQSLYEWLDTLGAENNCQWRFSDKTDPQGRELTVTAQWSHGKTPMEMRAEALAEVARLREALAEAETRHREHGAYIQLGGFRVGLDTAAAWLDQRAAVLDERRTHLEPNPDGYPGDIHYNLVEDFREGAAQARLDAKTIRDLSPPASFPDAALLADARLRAQHEEQVEDLRAQRDASHRREEALRRAAEGSTVPPAGWELAAMEQDGGAFIVTTGLEPRHHNLRRTMELAHYHRTHAECGFRWLAVDRKGRAIERPEVRRGAVMLLERDGRFAAIRAVKHGGAVELPGGKLREGEPPAEAAMREVREEVGLDVHFLMGLGDFLHKHEGTWWCSHAFFATAPEGDLVGSAEGEACWATHEEILAGTYGEVVGRILATYDRVRASMNKAQDALTEPSRD